MQYNNALKRTSLYSLDFQPLRFGSSLSFLRTTVTYCLLPQQREAISLHFSCSTLLWPRKRKLLYKGLPWHCCLEKRWEDSSAPFEAPMLFTEGTVLEFIVLCKLLDRSAISPPQRRWEAHRLPLRIVAGEAVKLM